MNARFGWNGMSVIKVLAKNFIIQDFDMDGNKVPMFYSKKEGESFAVVLETGGLQRDGVNLTQYKCRMSADGQIYIFRMNTMYLLLHCLYVSIPDYEIIPLSLIHICRCRRYAVCRSRWSPYH
eukprot:TRINITY_DN17413_c0_g2_i3.p4 TRINITY_DN17413_c0_g2~~TRINITY_DN17413_c0_g2_i3.p4  ORF type:complete len:123 (-),score=18.47 TRINITY_DN17413_c0_g2_i3:11-379(-)